MIRLDRISRQLGPRVLFEGLAWTVPERARIGLVGPNGAGKTTLLRLIAGRDRPDAGAIHRAKALRIGFLPQEVETVAGGRVVDVAAGGSEEVVRLGRELERVARRLEAVEPEGEEAGRLTREYGELRERFELLEGDTLDARARAVLGWLGIPDERMEAPIETLSGGWRMRAVLARLLLARPGLLLLDEPTNHLDLDALDWLETFLRDYEGAFVVVSHDRYFLNRMVETIVELDRGRLRAFPGSYDDYLEARRVEREGLEQAARQQAKERAKVERFIERFRYKNTKARQVQSRIKALERTERVEPEAVARRVRFGFPPAPRSGDVVARLSAVSRRFGSRTVYRDLDWVLRRGERIAVVGPNGAGKSTLLRLLAGRLAPDSGRVEPGHGVILRYYAQHQLDDLDPAATALEEMERVVEPGQLPRLRTLLGAFLFAGDDVDKRVGVLSGGERARLALARLLVQPSNLLLLDEPTNHLDLPSREVLEDALDEYGGTLVVVSHDRYFINRIATSVAEISPGRIEVVPGDYDEYVEWTRRRAAERERADAGAPTAAGPPAGGDRGVDADRGDSRREARRREAEARNRRYRRRRELQRKLDPLEGEIETLETRLGEVGRSQASERVYADPGRAAEAARERGEIERRLERAYAEWERLAAELEDDE